MTELLRSVAPLNIEDFLCDDPDVEDCFLEHYRDLGGAP